MVTDVVHLDTTISQRIKHGEEEKVEEDTISISTTSTDNCDGAVALQDTEDKAPCFQNIEVTNSSDVHFGNKTYYQGPVTIKQILYTGRDGEKSPQTNGAPPQLAINEKCVVDNDNYGNLNGGYTTDSDHPIIANGHNKLSNGIHDDFEAIKGTGDKKLTKTQWIIIGVAISVILVLIAITLALVFTLTPSNESTESPILGDVEDSPDSDYEPVLAPGLHLINRADWLAIPPRSAGTKLKTPVPYVILHHTASTRCRTLAQCKAIIINIQKLHMYSFDWPDIGYNFLVGGDGYSYEGRGWQSVGNHAKGYNTKGIGIALIGTFDMSLPSQAQMNQTQELIKEGVEKGYLKDDYKLLGMHQIHKESQSPGKAFLEEIKKWPHYVENP